MPRKSATKKSSARKPTKPAAKRSAPSGTAARKPLRAAKAGASKAAPAKSKSPKSPRSAPRSASAVESASQFDKLEHLIEMMVEREVVEVEIEEAGTRWRVRRAEPQTVTYAAPAAVPMHVPPVAPGATAVPGQAAAAPETSAAESVGEVFRSPMVGTFYRASSPDAEPFCKPGDVMNSDRPLCIIEAMKVMNEIKPESDQEFEIVDVLVKNGESVEFGQPLFLIR